MGHVFFLRHCKTRLNAYGMISGRLDSELVDKKVNGDIDKIDLDKLIIFSSDLMRCKKTLEIFLKKAQINPAIIYTPNLRERNMGLFEGKKRIDLQREYSKYFINQRFCYQLTPPEGEGYEEFVRRADLFINDEFLKYQNNNSSRDFIICAHNQILKILYCRFKNISIEKNWERIDFVSGNIVRIL